MYVLCTHIALYCISGYFILIEYSYPYFWPEKYTQNTLNFLPMSTQIQKEPLRNLFFNKSFEMGYCQSILASYARIW